MNDAPVDSSTTAAVSVAIPSMAMSELKQKVKEWYSDQKYADNTLKEAMVVFDNLCDYIGNQSVYTSQLGQDYMEYEYGRKNYSKSAKGEISRCVYIIDCLAFGKPISTRRSTFEPENVLSPGDNPVPFVLFSELNQMIQDWQNDTKRKSPPKNLHYYLKRMIHFVGYASCYTSEIGRSFLEHIHNSDYCGSYVRTYNRNVYLFDCITNVDSIRLRNEPPRFTVSSIFAYIYDEYANYCTDSCKKMSTAYKKELYAAKFLNNIASCGCCDLSELTPHIVFQACLIDPVSGCFYCYRFFLKYLADNEITMVDYSPLVPSERKAVKLPDVFSKDEILSLEGAYDRETDRGKRDYAIVLLASRLKLRPSDIVTLKFQEIDFESNHFQFEQQKTDVELKLPIVPEVKEALQDYIKVRPKSDSPYVFLRTRAPYLPLSRAAVYDVTSNGFEEAGVDPKGRGKGPKVLRSSGATHMVQGGESYKVVQDSLGQKNRNVIQHYARLDIPQLRQCAQTPPAVTEDSFFARFLKGEVTL